MATRTFQVVFFLLWVTLLGPQAFAQQSAELKPLTNDDVLEMIRGGFAEETIVQAIQSSRNNFDTSLPALKALKAAGVSEKIIQAMLAANDPKLAEKIDPPKPENVPDDIGVYMIKRGKLLELHPEMVSWRTGGVARSMFTLCYKGHINGVVQGPRSGLQLAGPVEFVIRLRDDVDITEYQLLRLDGKKDRREFRALTGGCFHASSGPDKYAVRYDAEKLAPRTYKIKLPDLAPGEYGFLGPTAAQFGPNAAAAAPPFMSSALTSGKLYTFSVIE